MGQALLNHIALLYAHKDINTDGARVNAIFAEDEDCQCCQAPVNVQILKWVMRPHNSV